MSRKYLLLDCNYLCHRARWSTGYLSYEGDATGVIYGFLKSLSSFQDIFNTSNFVFCWDSNTSKRKEIYPEYKANREKKEYTDEEQKFNRAFRRQMKKLRTTYLPMIGFRNVFIQRGYEADDIIASLCLYTLDNDDLEGVVISSDEDLYQCIEGNISFYNPRTSKTLTLQSFKKQYGIEPIRWGLVKSFAGCTTDNVKGVQGVGEKTAIRYMKKELGTYTKAHQAITSPEGINIFNRNKDLVILPMKGTQRFKLRRDNLSEQGWRQVTKMLGMKSIRDRMSFGKRR